MANISISAAMRKMAVVNKKYIDNVTPSIETELLYTMPADEIASYYASYPDYPGPRISVNTINLEANVTYLVEYMNIRNLFTTSVYNDDTISLWIGSHDKYVEIRDKCKPDPDNAWGVILDDTKTCFDFSIFCFPTVDNISDVEFTDLKIYKIQINNRISNFNLEDNVAIQNSLAVGARENGAWGSISMGDSTAYGFSSLALGQYSITTGDASLAGGRQSFATGWSSFALGYMATASGDMSHAEGGFTDAIGQSSHAEGNSTDAVGDYSHAEGSNTTSYGSCAHVEGKSSNGVYSSYVTHESSDEDIISYWKDTYKCSIAKGEASHVEGKDNLAIGVCTHVEGTTNLALSAYQHVQGRYNLEDTEGRYAHIVGNGANDSTTNWKEKRSNAHTLDWNGNAWYQGNVYVGGTNQDDADQLITEKKLNEPRDFVVLVDQDTGYNFSLQIRSGALISCMMIDGITINKQPTKTAYIEGEAFDPTGMEIIANYPDGGTEILDNSVFTFEPQYVTATTTEVKVIYNNCGVEHIYVVPVTVALFDPSVILIDFDYTTNDDGTYTITGWKETLNGEPSTEMVIPDNNLIIL